MTTYRPVVRAMLRLALIGGGAFAGYLLLSLFGGPAHAQADDGASLLSGVSTVAETVDEAYEPVEQQADVLREASTAVSTVTDAVDEGSEPVEQQAGSPSDVSTATSAVTDTVDEVSEAVEPEADVLGGLSTTTSTVTDEVDDLAEQVARDETSLLGGVTTTVSTVSNTVDSVTAQVAGDEAGLLGGVSATVSAVTGTVDDVAEPVERVVGETAGLDLPSPVDGVADQALDSPQSAAEPVVDSPVLEPPTEPFDQAAPSVGDSAGPGITFAPATVSDPAGRYDQPARAVAGRASGAAAEQAPVVVPVAPLRSAAPVPDLEVTAGAADRDPQPPAGPIRARLPGSGSGQLAAGAADPTPSSLGTPTEPGLPDAGSGRALLHEDVTGSGLVMPVGAPPG